MSAKTAKKVDLERLAAALPDFPFGYLISVDDDYRVHTVTVEPVLRGAVLDIGLIGGGTRNNLARRGDVTLVWPPAEPGGYSLIVDGIAEISDADPDTIPPGAWWCPPARCCTATPTPPRRPRAACTTAWCSPRP